MKRSISTLILVFILGIIAAVIYNKREECQIIQKIKNHLQNDCPLAQKLKTYFQNIEEEEPCYSDEESEVKQA